MLGFRVELLAPSVLPSSLTKVGSSHVFVGSRLGNSALLRFCEEKDELNTSVRDRKGTLCVLTLSLCVCVINLFPCFSLFAQKCLFLYVSVRDILALQW